jgi:hypothetical protein
MRYTLTLWKDDMGTFTQPGCRDSEDALWHVNRAREHDGLPPMDLDELNDALRHPRNSAMRATLTPEAE